MSQRAQILDERGVFGESGPVERRWIRALSELPMSVVAADERNEVVEAVEDLAADLEDS